MSKNRRVTWVQADCDELEYIIQNFENVPYNKKARVQIWTGDLADFIVRNLR